MTTRRNFLGMILALAASLSLPYGKLIARNSQNRSNQDQNPFADDDEDDDDLEESLYEHEEEELMDDEEEDDSWDEEEEEDDY